MSFDYNSQFQYTVETLENTPKHILLTGKAGTGKSTLLTYYRGISRKNHVVLASTGAAAVNISGQTIHSFFHFTPSITADEARKMGISHKETKLYKKLEMIIIDEVSMVRADLLDCVDEFLRASRQSKEPFGGIQMVFIGDLYQLPPVVQKDEIDIFRMLYSSPYFFDSNSYKRISRFEEFFEHIELQKIYRQSDQDFISMLNGIRTKNTNYWDLTQLNSRIQKEQIQDKDYIYLVTTNKQAEEINRLNLEKLPTESRQYQGIIESDFENKNLPTDIELTLKPGARVMFLNNDPEHRWINGTLGEVLGMYSDQANDNTPVIEVKIDGGDTVDVYPYTWTNYRSRLNEVTGKIEKDSVGSFTQLPLKLAWAITIHKSQGKTFEKVIIDIGYGTFASGQVYVALSRCKSLNGIILKRPIHQKHILLDDRINQFFNSKGK